MESLAAQVIELQETKDGERVETKPVMIMKNINPALGTVVVSTGNTAVMKVFNPENVAMATDGNRCSAFETVTLVKASVVNNTNTVLSSSDDTVLNFSDQGCVYILPEETDSVVNTEYVVTETHLPVDSNSLVEVVEDNTEHLGNVEQASDTIDSVEHSSESASHSVTNVGKSSTMITKSIGSGIKENSQVSNISEKKSPVIMFKWGSVNKPFRCQICDLSFEDGNLLRAHMERHANTNTEPKKPFQCTLCTKSFQSTRSLERHQFVHSGQLQKRCKYCYKVFANKENLDKHILMHSASKSLICQYCDQTYSTRNALETHLSFHTGQRQFKCKICEKSFNRKDSLDRHLLTHDTSKKRKHQCVECEKSFQFLFSLKRHVRSVHGMEPDGKKCEVCGKFIKNRENITRHMQIHDGVRPYACNDCGRKFTQKQHLVDHLVIHTNALPFNCKICGLSFRFKRSLNRHLKKHYTYHPYNRKLECVKCSEMLANEHELVQHVQNVHFKNHECLMCKLCFPKEENLLKHMLQVHSIYVETQKMAGIRVVNRSTETEPLLMEPMTGSSLVKDESNKVKVIDGDIENEEVTEDGEEGTVDIASETLETSADTENVKAAICDGQDVIYILCDNGQEIIQKVIENKDTSQTGINTCMLNCPKEVTTYALDGTQIIHLDNICAQTVANVQELESNSETVELSGTVEMENQIEEMSEEYADNTDANEDKEMSLNYDVDATQQEEIVAERTKLIQSLIDYAEKMQEKELSMTSSETKI